MDCDFSPSSPHLLPNGLFSPQNQISFELLALSGLSGFSTFKGGKMLIFQGFANSCIVREFPPFSFKVRIATLTRNQFGSNATWVRIPPSAPKTAPCGVLSFIFAANYARVARRNSNSPCPALCVPPGCNSPADCCKGAGESHRLRQVSPLNSTLGSDFRVRYKSYQQSRQIAIHRTTQDSSRSLGTN